MYYRINLFTGFFRFSRFVFCDFTKKITYRIVPFLTPTNVSDTELRLIMN